MPLEAAGEGSEMNLWLILLIIVIVLLLTGGGIYLR